jgi:hypothetical protein
MQGAARTERACKRKQKRSGLSRALPRVASGIVFSAFVVVAVLFIVFARAKRVEVTERLTLQWLGVTVGTNSFEEGNPLEKLLGDRIPAKGIDFGALKLRRPASYPPAGGDAPITAWVKASGPGLQELQFQFHHGFKVMTANRSGRELAHPPAMPYRVGPSNEVLFAISLYAFPRDERNVRLRLAPPLDNRQERRWAEFEFKNPLRGVCEVWQAEHLPATNGLGAGRFVLSQIFSNPTRLIFHAPSKGWFLSECTMWDEEGNRSRMSSAGYQEREITVGFAYPLEADRAWKVAAIFTRAPPHRLLGREQFVPEDRVQVEVGAGVSDVSTTNSAGVVHNWRLDGEKLSVWNATHPRKKPEFVLLSATNELGHEVKFLDNAWMDGSDYVTEVWWTREHPMAITVDLAVPRSISTEFYVRPARAREK